MRNIKSIFVNYNNIVDIIGEERIEERLRALHDIYIAFLEQVDVNGKIDVYLNDRVLMHTIMDYFTDITRLKEFHGIEKINQDKIIAYECSWLIKRKPIQILNEEKESLVYINEKFVLTILVNHLTKGKIDSFVGNEELNRLCDKLLYHLKYRNCDAKVFEMFILFFKAGNMMEAFEQ